ARAGKARSAARLLSRGTRNSRTAGDAAWVPAWRAAGVPYESYLESSRVPFRAWVSDRADLNRRLGHGQDVLFGQLGQMHLQGKAERVAVVGCAAELVHEGGPQFRVGCRRGLGPGCRVAGGDGQLDDAGVRGVPAGVDDGLALLILPGGEL